jgi:integrase
MASYSKRGDQTLAQVRQKVKGVIVFSESKLFDTDQLARSWGTQLEARLAREGVAGVTNARLSVGALILKHLAYLQSLRPLGRSAVQNHEYMAQQMDKIQLPDLRSKHLIDFARRRKAEGASPATIMANLSPVSAAIHAAPWAHGFKVDPSEVDIALKNLKASGVTAKSREVVRLVDQAEEDAMLAEFRRRNLMPQTEIDMDLCYQWALALPRRAGELTRIRWADVNVKKRTVIVRDVKHPRKKIGNDQVVPLLGEAWALLERTPKAAAEILPYNTGSMCAAFERVRNRIAETGLPSIADLRFHDLRHTGITMLFWRGLQIPEVAVVSGHTNWQQLQRYTHIKPEDLHRHWPGFVAPAGRLSYQEQVGDEVNAALISGQSPSEISKNLLKSAPDLAG